MAVAVIAKHEKANDAITTIKEWVETTQVDECVSIAMVEANEQMTTSLEQFERVRK